MDEVDFFVDIGARIYIPRCRIKLLSVYINKFMQYQPAILTKFNVVVCCTISASIYNIEGLVVNDGIHANFSGWCPHPSCWPADAIKVKAEGAHPYSVCIHTSKWCHEAKLRCKYYFLSIQHKLRPLPLTRILTYLLIGSIFS